MPIEVIYYISYMCDIVSNYGTVVSYLLKSILSVFMKSKSGNNPLYLICQIIALHIVSKNNEISYLKMTTTILEIKMSDSANNVLSKKRVQAKTQRKLKSKK